MWSGAPCYQRVAAIHEERAEPDPAVEYYNAFVELWANADVDLQPLVEDVRRRITRLVGETR